MMDAIERALAVLAHRRPDRLPVDLHNFQPAAAMLGLPLQEVFKNGDLIAESQLAAWREFGHDVLILESGTSSSAEACGVEVVYRDDAAPVATKPVLERLEDVEELVLRDPWTTFPWSEILKATQIVAREIGDRAFIIGRGDQGPFSLALMLRGYENFMIDIATNEKPDLIHKLLDYCRQTATRFALAQLEAGAHATSIGESPSGPDVLSPRHYRKWAFPHQQRMIAEFKAQGKLIAHHICGNTVPILDDFIATGAQITEIDHKTDLAKARDAAQGKTTILGPIDTNLLAFGTPDAVDAACREAIEIMRVGKDFHTSFILGPGCALDAKTPAENIHALVEAAKKYGMNGR
ncbi:MAG: uroporphyrinogen decarboxylase family protein [Anaerolineae bacterium]|nr:uroporphyrinogen decarboxylase family protein [Anaerolineae bacterium]